MKQLLRKVFQITKKKRLMDRGYPHNFKENLLSQIKLKRKEVRVPETKQQGRKRHNTSPQCVYYKRNFNEKVESHLYKTNHYFARTHGFTPVYRCTASHPLQDLTKLIYVSKSIRVGVFLCIQTSLDYFLLCSVINSETKFTFTIKAFNWLLHQYNIGKQT